MLCIFTPAFAGTLGGEPPDMSGQTYTITTAGAHTVTGAIGPTPGDTQDAFNIVIGSGQVVTSISYSGQTTDGYGNPLGFTLIGCGLMGSGGLSDFNHTFSPAQEGCTLQYYISTGFQGTGGNWTVTVNTMDKPNNAPTDVTLSNYSVSQSAGVNAVVGTFSTTDPDSSETFTYSLVSGTGSTNNTSFNISGDTLSANNTTTMSTGTYSIRVRTTDHGGLYFEKQMSINVTQYPPISANNTDSLDIINQVVFSSINKSSGSDTGGYGDYSALSTTMNRGTSANLTVYVGSNYVDATYQGYWSIKVFFDWNHDFDFEDAGEGLEVKYNITRAEIANPGFSPFTKSVTIPADAALGNTRMRIVYRWEPNLDEAVPSSGNFGWGEAEDYTINVTDPNTAPAFVGGTTTLTVNQNAGATDIKGLLHVSDSDSGQTETWSQSVAPNHGGSLVFTGATAVSGGADITPGGTITYQPAAGYSGTETFTVQVSDGLATATRTITVTIVPPPTVTGISPTGGPTAGGTSVTITGTNFTGATSVTIGGTAATGVTVVNATTITATTPAHAEGVADVAVTTPAGTGTGTGLFTYYAAPTVTGISPTGGPTAGGTAVTITGTNFTGATSVTIGGSAATGITVVNATTITATTPAGVAGAANVAVTTPGGTGIGAGLFTYIAAPTVTGISPTGGPTSGGTAVTITGTNFTGATSVTIGGSAATGITVVNATTITATTPAHAAGSVNVSVTTPGGTGTGTGLFTYYAAPTVTSISPTGGTTAGGTSVIITGTNFIGATAVSFGGTAAAGFTVNSSTQITATSPAGSGTVDITVTTPGGTSATGSADQFTYCPGSITVVSPNDSGVGSLRQAIADVCPGGTINFNGDYPITLESTLAISKNVTIDGSGHSVTVSGNSQRTVFSVSQSVAFNLNNVTVADGYGPNSGGIYNYRGTVAVTNSTFSSNTATVAAPQGGGAICNYGGTLTVTDSTFSGNTSYDSSCSGGAICNYNPAAVLTVTNSTFSGNSAPYGGGIRNNGGTVTVTDSTFSANSATAMMGGGISNNVGTVTVTGSTFSDNTASNAGGGISNGDALTVTNCTFSGNSVGGAGGGGGIYLGSSDAVVSVTNSTFSGNSATGTLGGGIHILLGTATIRNTVLWGNTGGEIIGSATVSNSVVQGGTSGSNIIVDDPLLGPLGDYGGSTQTFALLPGSSAIDAGDNAICATAPVNNLDQRGIARPQGTHCDIGAFESQGFTFGTPTGTPQSVLINTAFAAPLGITVSANYPGEPVDGGIVTFAAPSSGASIAETTPFTKSISAGGVSAIVTANATVGAYTVTAAAAGVATDASFSLNNQGQTTTTLSSSANPSVFGQSVTFTATVVPVPPASGTPTGTVTFKDNGVTLATVTLNGSGGATLTTSLLSVGTHPVTVEYAGDTDFTASSSSAVNQVVNQGSTTTAITSSQNPSVFGQSVTFTVTVATVAPASGTPAGTVTFSDNGTTIGAASLNGSGVATLTTSTLSVGTHPVTAEYAGDTHFTGSSSSAVNQVVNQGSTTTAITSSQNPSAFGQSVTFTATVTSVSPASGTPTGTVVFKDGGVNISGCDALTLNGSGQATCATSALSVGTHPITAVYSGDVSYLGSTGTLSPDQTVNCGNSITVVSTSDSGAGSLRQAIADTCAGGTIDFGITGTIGLTSGELAINKDMTISGPGADILTISGNNSSRVFNITGTAVTITDLTIANGRALGNYAYGGGMYINNVSPTLTNITFSGNTATGGNVSVGPGEPGDGGGICIIGGSPVLTNITFSGNSATGGNSSSDQPGGTGLGGGIRIIGGSPVLTNITFIGNSATGGNSSSGWPGGDGFGGGIMIDSSAHPTLTNITFSGNSATGGSGISSGGGSGGGMYMLGGGATITNSIFWGNAASTSGPEIYTTGSATIAYSVIAGGCPANMTCSNLFLTDPLLGPLADNGGPTQTMALLPGSSAIDEGTNIGCPTADQRGITRGSTCDIGAFESQGFTFGALTGTPQSATINTAFATPLGVTVSSAYGEPVDGGVITFTAPLSGPSITAASSQVTITGGAASLDVTANGSVGIYQVVASASGIALPAVFDLGNGRATQSTLDVHAPSDLTIGTSATLTSTGGSGSGAVTYQVTSGSCHVSGDQLTADAGTGTCTVTATKAADATYSEAVSTPATVTLHPFNKITGTVVSGPGSGTNVCAPSDVAYGGSFTCTLTPSKGYDLYGLYDNSINWTGSVSIIGNHYSYAASNVTADHTVKANFANYPVIILNGVNSDCEVSLTSAVTAATLNGDRIQAQALTFTEALNFAHPGIALSLEGGYDSGFSSPIGHSVIRGSVTISNGAVTVENITIR